MLERPCWRRPARHAVAACFALFAACANAQAPAQEISGSGLGNWFRNLGKSIDDATQGAAQGGNAAVDGINRTHAAVNGQVRGRVALQGGRTATCFQGITACYLGPAGMTSPGQAQGVPLMLVLADGRAVANNADQLAHFGVLVLPSPATGAAGGKADTGYRDRWGTGCVTPDMTGDEIVRNTQAIKECQTDVISERAWARSQAQQATTDAERKRAQQQLEADTRAKFEAIQRDAANPKK